MSVTPTPSERAGDTRQRLIGTADLVGAPLRERLAAYYDGWLASLVPEGESVALVAVGGLGRAEPAPHSDLDLVLLHDLPAARVRDMADSIWYPIWDSGVGLDHAVRTVSETAQLARSDVRVSLGLLDVRFIAGDAALADEAKARIASAWRVNAATRALELHDMVRERGAAYGNVAYLLQPDLKQAVGGLRDATILRAFARAGLLDVRPQLSDAITTLLDVRGEVQRQARKANDVLLAQDRAAIAAALGFYDGEDLLRAVNNAGRVVAYALDGAFRRAERRRAEEGSGGLRARLRLPSRSGAVRVGLAKDVVRQSGEVVLARDARPAEDHGLVLRVARAAAYADLPISAFTLDRLRAESPAEVGAWTEEMRLDFVALLAAGPPLLRVWESLDQHELLTRLLPEWAPVRSLPQRNAVHTYTVDRHLLQTALEVDGTGVMVSRQDLLWVSALLHDIGKGMPGDHSEVGAHVAREIAARMGFSPADCSLIERVVRYHLLLPDTALRRDLTDPKTIELVIDKIGRAPLVVELLHSLALADAKATGPAAYSQWKADLIAELVARIKAGQAGEPIDDIDLVDDFAAEVLAADPGEPFAAALAPSAGAYQRLVVVVREPDITTSQIAGVAALASLNIRRARITEVDGARLMDVIVEPRFGAMSSMQELADLLRRTLDGSLDLGERLARKAASYDRPTSVAMTKRWAAGVATNASVIEVQAADRTALLFHLMAAFESAGARVQAAVIESYGATVVDAFYLQCADGKVLTDRQKASVERALDAVSVPLLG